MTDDNNRIVIRDISLAAVLETLGHRVVDMEEGQDRFGKTRFNFVFDKTPEMERIMGSFWNDERMEIPIRTLFANLKMLKGRIYGLQNPGASQQLADFNPQRREGRSRRKEW